MIHRQNRENITFSYFYISAYIKRNIPNTIQLVVISFYQLLLLLLLFAPFNYIIHYSEVQHVTPSLANFYYHSSIHQTIIENVTSYIAGIFPYHFIMEIRVKTLA